MPFFGPIIAVLTFLLTGGFLLVFSGQFFSRYIFPSFGGIWLMAAVALTIKTKNKKVLSILFSCFKFIILAFTLFWGVIIYNTQYDSLKYDGIVKFREVMKSVDSDDVVMFSDTWSSMMEIYEPDRDYWIFGFRDKGLPFDYTEVYTYQEQLDEKNTVWIIGNTIIEIANMGNDYKEVERITFDHHEYHFIIKKYEKI
jgi:hypothetical protein